MEKDIIKTKFSKRGLSSVIAVFLPYIFSFFPTKYSAFEELSYSPKWLLVLHCFITIFMVLTMILIRNMHADPYTRNSRTVSIAAIILGIYYILWVYFYIGRANVWSYLCIKILGAAHLMVFSYDRRNWISFSLASLFLISSLSLTIFALV